MFGCMSSTGTSLNVTMKVLFVLFVYLLFITGSENRTQEGQIVLHHISDCADLLFRKNGTALS